MAMSSFYVADFELVRERLCTDECVFMCVQVSTVLKGVVRAERLDAPADFIQPILNRVKPIYVQRQYGIGEWSDSMDFLCKVALKSGRVLKGGEPDVNTIAINVINDWQRGKLPYFVAPPRSEDDEDNEGEGGDEPMGEAAGDEGGENNEMIEDEGDDDEDEDAEEIYDSEDGLDDDEEGDFEETNDDDEDEEEEEEEEDEEEEEPEVAVKSSSSSSSAPSKKRNFKELVSKSSKGKNAGAKSQSKKQVKFSDQNQDDWEDL
jgi:nuclear GTP-binding protein